MKRNEIEVNKTPTATKLELSKETLKALHVRTFLRVGGQQVSGSARNLAICSGSCTI